MDKKLGVYIHIPFCASKCGYCDFYSEAGCDKLMPKYHNAIIEHIRESAPQLRRYYTDTVYFGGGTPSYYGTRRICEIFNALKRYGLIYKSAEVTVEINPDSVRRHDFKVLLDEGVNRLSIGAQSANDDILKLIGRRHNWKRVTTTVSSARKAGFKNISIDLIYGLPSQTKSDWADTLTKALRLKPDHISCYGLKLEPGTPMHTTYRDSQMLPTEDEQADMYLYATETLARFGYNQYEISSFALSGKQSRHNLKYWLLHDYMAFGSGASSCIENVRYSFVSDLRAYIDGVMGEGSVVSEYEKIRFIERAAEYLMLGMRTTHGISQKEYHNIYRSDFEPIENRLEEFERKGWTKFENSRWSFTPAGFLLSNLLIGVLLDTQAEYKVSGNPWIDTMDMFIEKTELPAGDEVFYRGRK